MQDHGADAATVVANASVDMSKEALHITAELMKFLFLKAREGSRIKAGETNIDKLIQSLDEGDRIKSAVIDPSHANEIAKLSKQHGVVYAMVENQEGQMIVYYKESEAERMQHIFEDILQDNVKEETDSKQETSSEEPGTQKEDESKTVESEKSKSKQETNKEMGVVEPDDQPIRSADELFQVGVSQQEFTTVIFNQDNPMDFVEIFFDVDGNAQFAIYQNGELLSKDGLPTQEQARHEVDSYVQHGSFQIKGSSYKEKELLQMIQQVTEKQKEKQQLQMKQEERASFMDKLMQQPAWMDGSLHVVSDAQNPNNFIAVYKELETNEAGIATKNTVQVYTDGIEQIGADPVKAFAGYEEYKHTEQTGRSAAKHFNKLQQQSQQLMNAKIEKIEREAVPKKLPPETHVIFDAGKSNHFVELRQSDETVQTFLHKGKSVLQVSAVQAAKQIKEYQDPMTMVAKGHYDHDTLYQKVDGIAKEQIAEQQLVAVAAAKEEKLKDIFAEMAGLDGTLHTFIDAKNTNNRIYIYKDIQQVNGELKTVNQSLVFLDGQKAKVRPEAALQQMEKYRHTEKSGKGVTGQFEKLLQSDEMNWTRKKSKGDVELGTEGDGAEKKPLAEYEKAVAKIKATREANMVPEVKLSIGSKEASVRGER
ncbi:DUF3801 domain-containing protein [Sinanaerobacter sp. ZZT-01]|uniref:DUF3801 domain-containing protein n=1 Tax=Sinanaerobacter sp. ZZT-01 TaxID=3111540 RepID=UPI002D790A2B|nr:DUF3801 domain-containing protein [Sinanaerobacter sp. ZZT-01]WRR94244.1 DUF3801 domain-containing protein [Sinanaerobacter sp. ZZT-01]